MSTALNLPLWQCNSPPNSPDSSEDFDLIMGRLSSGDKPSFYGVSRLESRIREENDGRSNSASDCESFGRGKYDDECRLNNNASDSGDCEVEKCNAVRARGRHGKRRRSRNVSSDGEKSSRRKRRKCCGKSEESRLNDSMCGVSSECDAGTVGGDDDDGDEEPERSPRRQRELTRSDEIDKPDVIKSRDITSNPLIGNKSCASTETCGEGKSYRKGSCSAGSYSRRKHHKHKHKRRTRSPSPEVPETPVNPKVNPIFLWVRQDDTRIVEVMCEDYDHRNRIRLTRTHLGWRAIPKTERFATAIVPKAPSPTETVPEENCVKRSKRRKGRKKKKSKKRKVPVQWEPDESPNTVEESSVTLTENDVEPAEKTETCEDACEDVCEDASQDAGEDMDEDACDDVGQDTCEDAGEDVDEDADEEAGQDTCEDADEDACDEVGQDTCEDAGEDVDEDADEEAGQDTCEDAGEDVDEDADEDACDEVGQDTCEDAGEDVDEDADEEAGQDTCGDAGEDADEEACDDVGQDTFEDAAEDAEEEADEDAGQDTCEDADEDASQDICEDARDDVGQDNCEDACEDAGQDTCKDPGKNTSKDADEDAPNVTGRDSADTTSIPPSRENQPPSLSPSVEPPNEKCETEEPPRRLTKSFSCDFSLMPKRARTLVRTSSLDLDMDGETRLELERNFKVQKDRIGENVQALTDNVKESDPADKPDKAEREPDLTKEDAKCVETTEEKPPEEVNDAGKRDTNFNDPDCDELGELLKDIHELEFAEQREQQQEQGALEEDENDEWLTPTDLTVPKAKTEEREPPKAKYPVLPPNISPLVTVTSTTRAPEPLTAPLPEVTITPIPNPKPAHQQKRQNNFLESLLSSPYPVKPEKDEITVTRCDKRPAEKKKPEEPRSKKMKVEDITLKSLLSKQHVEKSLKGLELENHVKKMRSKQESEHSDMSKSRLHELLTEGVSNSDPISQLKQVLSNPDLAVPDPLLVPRARLPALVASPASEIPRLLSMHLDKKVEETPRPPLTDPDMLEVSLSNLRSLLSCNSDKIKSTDADDIASYQKSLEAFLEWQRYQTDLIEARMKNGQLTPGLSPTDIDLATATALNQMLWLPYLEFNGNAMSAPMNSVFPHNYPNNMTALPHISTNHFPQSSPFLTPTSPMEIDAQMKTLAMWQEAVMAQQTAHQSRKVPSTLVSSAQMDGRNIKVPNVPPQKKQRPSPIPSPQKTRNYSPRQEPQKNHFNFDSHLQLQRLQQQQEAFLRQQYEMQRKLQKRSAELHRQSQEHQRQRQEQMHRLQQSFEAEAEKKNRGPPTAKPFANPVEKTARGGKKQSWQQFEQDLRKNAEMTNQMALRWHQFEEEMRRNRTRGKAKADNYADWSQTGCVQQKIQETGYQAAARDKRETAKLKVKNLVDPNMSPPKLLKHMTPEELSVATEEAVPLQDESQAHLWHPLFGSNQIKPQQYNSPWRWTTVTVNGE